jgi:hypothetical protein
VEELESETRIVCFIGYGYNVRYQNKGFKVVSSTYTVLLENRYRTGKVNVFRAAVILMLIIVIIIIIIQQ